MTEGGQMPPGPGTGPDATPPGPVPDGSGQGGATADPADRQAPAAEPLVQPPKPRGALAAAPTLADVRACYRLILGREPEDEAVLQRHLDKTPTLAALRARFLGSEEFRSRSAPSLLPPMPLAPEPIAVEAEATPLQLAAMLARTARFWERIGAEAPHWSVLTQDRFRPENIAKARDAFYETGGNDLALVKGFLDRAGAAPEGFRRVVEFGCGVGRATLALATIFPKVIGCDVSAAHLALARKEAAARGAENVAWFRSTVERPMPGGGWDLWFSRMVLQHNPPPVMAWLLREAFARLLPGGLAIFQLPTHRIGYRFAVAEYLARTGEPEMEMHVLPQAAVFALAAEAGLEVIETREDSHVVTSNPSLWVSNVFVLRRPRPRRRERGGAA